MFVSTPLKRKQEHLPPLTAKSSARRVQAFPCILSTVVCAFALCLVLRVDHLHLRVPLTYWGDAIYFDTWVKGVMEGNWPWHNARLGMPFGADWRDFPINLTIETILIRVLAIFTSSSGLVLNASWLLGTAASAGLAAYGLQRLGVEKWVAGALGVIYGLQPFTFYRGVSHFNLMFYLVPLMATAAIEMAAGYMSTHLMNDSKTAVTHWSRWVAVIRAIPVYVYVGCVAQGISYIYNSFFSVILFAVAGLVAYVVSRRRAALVGSFVAIFLTCGAALLTLSPSLLYWAANGKNPAMNYKSPEQAEFYALKLRYLLTPTPENPLPPLRYIQKKLDGAGFASDNSNESTTSRLGTIGSVGLLFLLGSTLSFCLHGRFDGDPTSRVLGACCALTLTCFFLGTVGGFGSLFSVFVTPDIRGYNRIIVFIDFFALVAVGLLLTRAAASLRRRHWPKSALVGALTSLVVFGVSDQAVTATYRDHIPRETEFKMDVAFVRLIESILPRNAEVFQLPFTDFPMNSSAFHMGIYDQGKAYLHSNTLRWSWAGMSGRESGEWARQTANLPVRDMLTRLSAAGFSGIWIDRFGYAPGNSPEREIAAALGSQARERPDGRIVFYDLTTYTKQVKNGERSGGLDLAGKQASSAILVTFPSGCYGEEQNDKQSWRWCSQRALLQLYNNLSQPQTVKLMVTLQTGHPQTETIRVSAGGQAETVKVTSHTAAYTQTMRLPPRQSIDVRFDCECNKINAPDDSRNLYFALINLKVLK